MDFSVLRVFLLIVVGYGVMLGLVSRRKLGRILARMVIVPIVIFIFWSLAVSAWDQWTLTERVAALGLVILGAMLYFLFGTRFGRDVLAGFLGHVLHDLVAGVFRLLRGAFRLVGSLVRRLWK